MFWALGAVVVVVMLGAYAWRAAHRPLPYRHLLLPQVERFLDVFLHQGGDGSVLMLSRESGAGFLQLALISRRGDKERLEFGLPDVDWSADHFDAVREALER